MIRRLVAAALLVPFSVPGGSEAALIDLAPTRDGTATIAAPAEGDFDGGGWSYDAELLPPAGRVTWNGTTYLTPDPTGAAKNFLPAAGQTLVLPEGSYSTAAFVATSYNGPVGGVVTIGYTDGTAEARSIAVGDWCNAPQAGTTNVLNMPWRIKAGRGVDGPGTSLFGLNLRLNSGKRLRSLTLPADERINFYALTLK